MERLVEALHFAPPMEVPSRLASRNIGRNCYETRSSCEDEQVLTDD